ncbi:acyl carrier protein [Nocardiopsis terrae]
MNDTGATAPLDDSALLLGVRRAWAEALGLDSVDEVPLDVGFLDAGGSSMLLVMLWEELNELTDATLRMSDLFRHSTVKEQVVLLTGEADSRVRVGSVDRSRLLDRSRAVRVTTPGGGEGR